MVGTRCQCWLGKEVFLHAILALLLYLPLGGFQEKLLPWQGTAVMTRKQIGTYLRRGSTRVFINAHTICMPGQSKNKPALPIQFEIPPQCRWIHTESHKPTSSLLALSLTRREMSLRGALPMYASTLQST